MIVIFPANIDLFCICNICCSSDVNRLSQTSSCENAEAFLVIVIFPANIDLFCICNICCSSDVNRLSQTSSCENAELSL